MKKISIFVVSLFAGGFIVASAPALKSPQFTLEYVQRAQEITPEHLAAISDWQMLPQPAYTGRLSTQHVYLRMRIENATEPLHGVVELPFRRLERVDLLERHPTGWQIIRSGALTPISDRPFSSAQLAFPLVMQAGEKRELYLHIFSRTVVKVEPVIRTQREFIRLSARDMLFAGCFSGLLLLMMLYNIILYSTLKSRVYLAYLLSNLGALVYYLSYDGIMASFITPEWPAFGHGLQSPAGYWMAGTTVIFVASFTGLRNNRPLLYRIIVGYGLIVILTAIFGHWILGPAVLNRTVPIVSVSALPIAIVALVLKSGPVTADYRWFRAGTLVFMGFALMFIAFLYSGVPDNIFTRNTLRIGTLLELLAYSVALAMRIRSIDRQRKDAEIRAAARTQFAAMLSHEIRTPLSAVVGITDLLHGTELSAQQKKYLASLESATSVLNALASDVLTFAKLDADKVKLEEISFSPLQLVQKTIEVYRFTAAEKKIRMQCESAVGEDLRLMGDPGKISQILNNLVSNALKFTPESGSVTITLSAMSISNKYILVLAVTDTGIGIPVEKQKDLFQAFTQVAAETERLYGGTGLGLNISLNLAKLMKGRIEFESTPGKGSRFVCTIPLAIAGAAAGSEVDYALILRTLPQQLRILHIDDSPEVRMLFQFYFANTHHQVDLADSAEQGLRMFRENQYDFVFSDYQMPGMNGLVGLEQMQREDLARGGHCHFVLVSGSLPGESLTGSPFRFLLKPVKTRDVYALIAELGGFVPPKR